MTKDKALDLALEALEEYCEHGAILRPLEVRDAIKQARALDKKAENARELGLDYEPVSIDANMRNVLHRALKRSGKVIPPPAQPAPVQEHTATVTSESGNPDVTMSWWHEPALPVGTKLYTTPPAAQRQWVGLTDEEILAANYPDGEENGPTISAPNFELDCFAKQVEAKLRSKNT